MDYTVPNPGLYNLPFMAEQFNGMPYHRLGTSGLQVSRIGLGTWKLGYPEDGDGSRVDEKTAFNLFEKSVELGVTFWDTANRYNNASGNSERVIGNWLHANPEQRRNVVIATKISGLMDGKTPNHCGLSRLNIIESVKASLQRLRTDYVDVLYFHSFDESTPIEESVCAVEDLVREGLIRYFAVSNFTVSQLEAYQTVIKRMSMRCRIVAVQNQYDPLNGEQEQRQGVVDYAASHGISFIPWSPLAGGLLSGRYVDTKHAGPGDRLYDEGKLKLELSVETNQKLQQLSAMSEELGIQPSQLTLAYMLCLPGMSAMIPSVSTIKQLESNAIAGRVILTDVQQQQLAELFRKD